MSFIGDTTALNIKTTNGRTFRIFITEQQGGFWIATILYADNGNVTTRNEIDNTREDAYIKACEWVYNNIDDKAVIDPLL